MLFTSGKVKQARIVKHTLYELYGVASMETNMDKSKVFVLSCISLRRKATMRDLLEMNFTDNLGRYLGIPLKQGRVTKEIYRYVLDKIHSKLSTWKSSCLFLAGRATLIHNTLTAISINSMQTQWLNQSICNGNNRVVEASCGT